MNTTDMITKIKYPTANENIVRLVSILEKNNIGFSFLTLGNKILGIVTENSIRIYDVGDGYNLFHHTRHVLLTYEYVHGNIIDLLNNSVALPL